MFRRRRPLMRAAMVGGVAYHAGKKVQQGREQDAETEERLQDSRHSSSTQRSSSNTHRLRPPVECPPRSSNSSSSLPN
jgi:hypothetical protein